MVLFSIVLGLGLTELLSSLHHLFHPRTRVKWHWIPLVWAFLVFIAVVQLWWSMFEFGRASDLPNFFELVLICGSVEVPHRHEFQPAFAALSGVLILGESLSTAQLVHLSLRIGDCVPRVDR